jgi:hypothetical protein
LIQLAAMRRNKILHAVYSGKVSEFTQNIVWLMATKDDVSSEVTPKHLSYFFMESDRYAGGSHAHCHEYSFCYLC